MNILVIGNGFDFKRSKDWATGMIIRESIPSKNKQKIPFLYVFEHLYGLSCIR